MHLVSLTDLNDYCRRALGQINKIYLHWTAGRYNQQFDDYHINIDRDGNIYVDGELTDHKNHTYMRNGSAVGIALDCAYGAQWTDNLGDYAPTDAQIETLAQVVALLCVDLGIPCDIDVPGSGGDVIRGKAKYYAQQWGSNI